MIEPRHPVLVITHGLEHIVRQKGFGGEKQHQTQETEGQCRLNMYTDDSQPGTGGLAAPQNPQALATLLTPQSLQM